MFESKLDVPAELRQLAEKTIDQAEKAFGLFFDAARRSTATTTISTAELSKQVLAFAEQISFEHARKVASISAIQEVATAESELCGVRWPMRSTTFGS
jgi:hypothetical protein